MSVPPEVDVEGKNLDYPGRPIIQDRQQVLKVRVRQISTAEDKLDLTKVTAGTKTIKAIHNLVTDGKYFHSGRIVPQNNVPGKGF